MPVIGFLGVTSPGPFAPFVAAFLQGLSETGYVEGQNVAIEYHWAEGRYDQLPALAADLVSRKVDVIATSGGTSVALAVKNATATIPVVFETGINPVETGLVASFARPGGNLTGVAILTAELNPKRLDLLSELVPEARVKGDPRWHSDHFSVVRPQSAGAGGPAARLRAHRDVAPQQRRDRGVRVADLDPQPRRRRCRLAVLAGAVSRDLHRNLLPDPILAP
jgi:putative ABC transport system substrate-binding protein